MPPTIALPCCGLANRLRVVFSAVCDDTRLFAGCDDGTVHLFDYSAAANPESSVTGMAGGFSATQKAALAAALEAAQRRPAHRTPGRIRPAAA